MNRKGRKKSLFDVAGVQPTQVKEMSDFNKLLVLSMLSALRLNCECQTCKRLRKASEFWEKMVEGL